MTPGRQRPERLATGILFLETLRERLSLIRKEGRATWKRS
jgi:hypothetical protein